MFHLNARLSVVAASWLVFHALLGAHPAFSQDDSSQSVAAAARANREKHAASSVVSAPVAHPPFTQIQILSWQIAGVSPTVLLASLKANGIAFTADDSHLAPLREAQLAPDLLAVLPTIPSHPETAGQTDVPQPLIAASQSFSAKDYAAARKSLDSLAQQTPTADIYAAVGNVAFLAHDLPAAKSAFERALQLDPSFVYAHVRLAGVYYALQNGNMASVEAKKGLQLQPGNPEAREYLSLSLSMKLQSKDSAASSTGSEPGDLSDLGLNDGDNQQAKDLNNEGIALMNQSQYQAAEAKFKAAIQVEPKVALWYYNLGVNYGKWGGHNVVQLDAYKKAKELAPNNLAVRQNLGAYYCHNHAYNNAIPEFVEILKMDPDWNMARPCLYISLYNAGRKSEAAQVLVEYRHWNQTHGVPDDSAEIEAHEPTIDDPRGGVHL